MDATLSQILTYLYQLEIENKQLKEELAAVKMQAELSRLTIQPHGSDAPPELGLKAV